MEAPTQSLKQENVTQGASAIISNLTGGELDWLVLFFISTGRDAWKRPVHHGVQ